MVMGFACHHTLNRLTLHPIVDCRIFSVKQD
jgi:hypothetical protein